MAKKAKPAVKRPRGRPLWEPTREQRLMVELGVANGFTREEIARALGKSVDSLERHCAEELQGGDIKAALKISGSLMQRAMKGDVGAIVWWEKTRRGMRDLSRVEHTGKDGGPVEYKDLSDEEIDARVTALIAGDGPGVTTH